MQKDMGWLLLQGICCSHPERITAPSPISAVAEKESISISSSFLSSLFLHPFSFNTLLANLHENFSHFKLSGLFSTSPLPHPTPGSATTLPPPATLNFAHMAEKPWKTMLNYKYPAAICRIPTLPMLGHYTNQQHNVTSKTNHRHVNADSSGKI